MASSALPEVTRVSAIRRVQIITVLWMSVEVAISAVAAARAHSIALLAFGGDSLIELLSALVVLFRFTGTRLAERRAARLTAVLLFCLAGFVLCASALSLAKILQPPQPSYLGIALLLAAATVMPWLARKKRGLALETGSSALAADAAQSSLCAWLSWIALGGLVLNSLFHISWADPLAALAILPVVVREGRDAWQERGCHCC